MFVFVSILRVLFNLHGTIFLWFFLFILFVFLLVHEEI